MSGSLAMQSSTWAWFVRNVQWLVPSLDIDDSFVLYSVSRFCYAFLLSRVLCRRLANQPDRVTGRGREMGSVDPVRITVDEERQAVARARKLTGISDLGQWKPEGRPSHPGSGASGRAKTSSSSRSLASTTSTRLHRCRRHFVRDRRRRQDHRCRSDRDDVPRLDDAACVSSARNELRDGGRLLLVTDDATVKRVFEITGIDRFFDFYPSRRAAEEDVRSI